MATRAPSNDAASGDARREDAPTTGWKQLLGNVVRSWLLFAGIKWVMQRTTGGSSPGNGPADLQDGKTGVVQAHPGRGATVDVHVYVGDAAPFPLAAEGKAQPIWTLLGAELGGPSKTEVVELPLARRWQDNKTMPHAFVYVTPNGASPNPWDSTYDPTATIHAVHPLAFYGPLPKQKNQGKLLERKNETEKQPEVQVDQPWAMHLRPNLTIHVLDLLGKVSLTKTHPQVRSLMRVNHEKGTFRPILWMNDFWVMKDQCIIVNNTVDRVQMEINWGAQPVWKWQLLTQMEQSFAVQEQFGTMAAGESDQIKKIFLEGNPYMLALTMLVSLLHTVFDIFAFKNDIGFWKSNKSMEGLSARTIMINVFCQLVILLYLLDNDTSFVVLLSSGMGLLIEIWKVTKAMDVTFRSEGKWAFKVQDRESYKTSKTKEYDEIATRYLSYALYPLIFCYTIYSLLYQEHKSWYSFILNTMVGCVYTFGFILMCPQLYINYRLKSVAHLPWRQMSYKFLNTIIDDLFAFVIHMPLMHRLSVFRDDVIFLIYLYQRWIYPVDSKRVNEFGYSAEKSEEEQAGNESGGEDQGGVSAEESLPKQEDTRTQETEAVSEETKKDK